MGEKECKHIVLIKWNYDDTDTYSIGDIEKYFYSGIKHLKRTEKPFKNYYYNLENYYEGIERFKFCPMCGKSVKTIEREYFSK